MRIRAHLIVGLLVLFGPATSSAQVPWTVSIYLTANPLPIGSCHTVEYKAFDPIIKGTPRNELGHYVSTYADFDLGVEGAAVGKYEGTIWSVCACQFATIGAPATITATYPAKALPEKSRVPGVAFSMKVPFTFAAATSKYNAAGCDKLQTAIAASTTSQASPPKLTAVLPPVTVAPAPAPAPPPARVAVAPPPSAPPVTLAPVPAPAPSPPVAATLPPRVPPVTLAPASAPALPPAVVALPPSTPPVTVAPAAAPTTAQVGSVLPSNVQPVTVVGLGPQNLHVGPLYPGWPTIHILSWDRPAGVSGYNVYISRIPGSGQWTSANSTPLLSETFRDSAARLPGTGYRVTALYADARQGSTDIVYDNPPQLKVPPYVYSKQISPGTVRVVWDPISVDGNWYDGWYRVMGSGQPRYGTPVQAVRYNVFKEAYEQSFDISGLADGTYTWQVTTDYNGIYKTDSLNSTTITLKTVIAPPAPPPEAQPRFRVSILGFKAIVETNDDLLSRDGAHNEVYAAATVCVGDPGAQAGTYWAPPHVFCTLARSAIHGDVNGFPGRVKAGSGSASGGITSGDMIGSGPSGTMPVSTITFPFLLWEGTLTPGKEVVWIAPSLWERGGNDNELGNWRSWAEQSLDLSNQTGPGMQSLGGGFVFVTMAPTGLSGYHSPTNKCAFDRGSDRPIGLAPPMIAGGDPGLVCYAFGLTRAKAEAVLAAPPQEAGNPVGVLTMDLNDTVSGHYVMWLKLERVK